MRRRHRFQDKPELVHDRYEWFFASGIPYKCFGGVASNQFVTLMQYSNSEWIYDDGTHFMYTERISAELRHD